VNDIGRNTSETRNAAVDEASSAYGFEASILDQPVDCTVFPTDEIVKARARKV
jgi:hypothetical protein